tara:strand:+ start:2994 stop:5009 length:2016 start_codon:yes stop_codon:yes gene_type:complete
MKNFTLPYSGKTKAMDILNILLITFFIGLIFYYLKNTFSDKNVEGMFTGGNIKTWDNIRVGDVIQVRFPGRCDMGGKKRGTEIECEKDGITLYNSRTGQTIKVKGQAYSTWGLYNRKGQIRKMSFYNGMKVPIPDGQNANLTYSSINGGEHRWNRVKATLGRSDNGANRDVRDRFNLAVKKERGQDYLFINRIASSAFKYDKKVKSVNDTSDGNNYYLPKSAGWGSKKTFAYKVTRKNSEPKAQAKCPDPKTTKQYKELQNDNNQFKNARDRFKRERDGYKTERDGYQRQRDAANKKLGIIYGGLQYVPPGYDKLKNIPALEKQITELEDRRDKIKRRRDEFRSLYDKALKRINNPIDGDPSGLNAQIEQLKQSATSAKTQYEKNSAAAEARRLAEVKAEQEKAAGAAEVASIKLSEEVAATDSALEQARKAKRNAETERRQYMELRKRLEARINQLNAQQGKSNEELFAALDKINELKQISLDERSKMKERIKRERADAVADERSLMAKSYRRRLRNRMQRFIRRFNLEEERKRQETVRKQREKTQELLSLRRNYLDQYTMDLHDQAKLEKEENMLKQVQRSKTNILTMNKNKENQENEVEPSYTGNNSSQPLMIDGQQNEGKTRITDNRRKQFGIHQSNVYLTVPKDAKKDEVSVGRKTIGGYVFPVSD